MSYPRNKDEIISLIDAAFENEDIFKKNNSVIKQRIIASDPDYIKLVVTQIKAALESSNRTDVSKFLSLYLLKNCLGTENEHFLKEVQKELSDYLCILFKTPQQVIFGPTPNITISSNFHQLLKELLYCLAFKFGADARYSKLAEIPSKAGEKIKPKKFIFFKEFNPDQKKMAESVPNKDQTQKDKPKDTKNQEKPNRSVIDVKPVTMDKPQSSRQAKSSIELELEKAIREKEELIATIMNLENSEDKTIANIAKDQIDSLSLKYENIFISISQTTQGDESDKLMSKCIEENNLITKINEWLTQFINNKCKAEQLKTRVSEILYDFRRDKPSSRNISMHEDEKDVNKSNEKIGFKTTPVETGGSMLNNPPRKRSEEVPKTESVRDKRKEDDERRAEEQRRADEQRRAEEQKRAEELKRAEEQRRADEQRRIEEQRRADEERRIEEQKRLAEQRRAEELKRAEEQRKADEQRKINQKKYEERAIEEQRLQQEEKVKRAGKHEPAPSFGNENDPFKDVEKKTKDADESSESQFNFDYEKKHETPRDTDRQSADFGNGKQNKAKPVASSKPPLNNKPETTEREQFEFDNPFAKGKETPRDQKTSKRTESPKRSTEEQQEFADELLKRTQRSDASETQRLKNEKEKVYEELTRIRKDYNDLMMEYEGMKNNNQNINKDFNKVRQELETLKSKYNVTNESKDQITRENEEYERLRQNLFRDRAFLLRNMETLQTEMRILRDRLNEYESRNTKSEDPRITELMKVLDDTQNQYERMHTLFQKVLGDDVLTKEEQQRLRNIDFRNQTQNLTERVLDLANQSRTYSPPRQRYEDVGDFPSYKASVKSPKYSSGSRWFNPIENEYSERAQAHIQSSLSPIRSQQNNQYTLRSPYPESRSPIKTLVEYKEYKPNPKTIQYVSKTEKTRKKLGSMGTLSSLQSGARVQYFNDNYNELPTFARGETESERPTQMLTRSREVRYEINQAQTLPTDYLNTYGTNRQLSPIRTLPTEPSVRIGTEIMESQEFRRDIEPIVQVFTENYQYENTSKSRKTLSRRESVSGFKTANERPPSADLVERHDPNANLKIVTLPTVTIQDNVRESTGHLSTASFNKEPITTIQYINNLKQISPSRSSVTASFPNTLVNSAVQKDNSPPRVSVLSVPTITPLQFGQGTGSIRDSSPNRGSVAQSDLSTPSKPINTANTSMTTSTSNILDMIDKQLARSRMTGSASKEANQTNVLEPGKGAYDFSKSLPPSMSSSSLKKIMIGNPVTENTNKFNPTALPMPSTTTTIKSFTPIQSVSTNNLFQTFNPVSDISTIRPESPSRFPFHEFASKSPEKSEKTIQADAKDRILNNNTLVLGSPGSHVGDSFLSKGDIVQVTRTQYKDPMESLARTKLDDSMRIKEIRNVPQVKFTASNL